MTALPDRLREHIRQWTTSEQYDLMYQSADLIERQQREYGLLEDAAANLEADIKRKDAVIERLRKELQSIIWEVQNCDVMASSTFKSETLASIASIAGKALEEV